MPVISSRHFCSIAQNLQAALRKFDRLVGMFGGDAVEARDEFIYARIVFHGAGAERIHAQINGVIPGGKAREVADHFDFADFGEAFDFGAQVLPRPARCAASTAGTSSGGSSMPRLPGADFSKISPSFWLTWRRALRDLAGFQFAALRFGL